MITFKNEEERELFIDILDEYSDCHKELYGFRPRGKNFESIEQLKDELKYIREELRKK